MCTNAYIFNKSSYIHIKQSHAKTLTARGIDTKVVFLIYLDLLWAPVQEKLRNPDRFVLMFAPISRTYSKTFSVTEDEVVAIDVPPYVRNQVKLPSSVAENVAMLRNWQKQFEGDSFDFDYHLMWDHLKDPGHITCARTLAEDMKNLRNLGLGGMNSCQLQRAHLPTSLPMVAMAETLWNREREFSDIAREYFCRAFGEDGIKVWKYLAALSATFDPPYLRCETPAIDPERARVFGGIPTLVGNFMPIIARNVAKASLPEAVRESWEFLLYHGHIVSLLAEALAYRAEGQTVEAKAVFDRLKDYLFRMEETLHPVLDVSLYASTLGRLFP